jgi:hypothetical protein
VLTLEVVNALTEIGAPQALAALQKLESRKVVFGQQIRKAISGSIRAWEPKRPLSGVPEGFLTIAEDSSLPLKTRANALAALRPPFHGWLPAHRLAKLAQADTVLTYEVVNLLGDIGTPQALAELEKLENRKTIFSEKIRKAISASIRACNTTIANRSRKTGE